MPAKSFRDRVIEKLRGLVERNFQGNYATAFTYYDKDLDGFVGRDEVTKLVTDAGVGNSLARDVVVNKIFQEVDADRDSSISLEEFMKVLNTPDLGRASPWD